MACRYWAFGSVSIETKGTFHKERIRNSTTRTYSDRLENVRMLFPRCCFSPGPRGLKVLPSFCRPYFQLKNGVSPVALTFVSAPRTPHPPLGRHFSQESLKQRWTTELSMVTGVETAGIVLAILPLAIEGLKAYLEGVRTIEKWWRFDRELANLVRTLDAEYIRYLNTCEELLVGIVPPSTVGALLASPSGDGWRAPDIERNLRLRLRRSFPSFMETVYDMENVVQQLVKKLGLDLDSKVSPIDFTTTSPLILCFLDQLQWVDAAVPRSELKRIKLTLSKTKFDADLRRIEKNNNILAELLGQNLRWEAVSKTSRQDHGLEYRYIRQQAESIHRVLAQYWNCSCQVAHKANLRLEARIARADPMKTAGGVPDAAQIVRFRVIFSFEHDKRTTFTLPWTLKAADIEPFDDENPSEHGAQESSADLRPPPSPLRLTRSTPLAAVTPSPRLPSPAGPSIRRYSRLRSISSHAERCTPKRSVMFAVPAPPLPPTPRQRSRSPQPPNLIKIQNLCAAIKNGGHDNTCLGVLVDELKRQNHGLYLVQRSLLDDQAQATIPLTLRLATTGPARRRFKLTRKNGLQLALTLASSVLQLHKTPWLGSKWGKDDILFFQGPNGTLLEQPFISKSFSSIQGQTLTSRKLARPFPCVRNEMIFALGVVLIELCLGCPLEEMRTPEDLDDFGNPNVFTDYMTAQRLVPEVYEEGGGRYGDVVRRCIHCDFDQPEVNFDVEAFCKAFQKGVISPLWEDYDDFVSLSASRAILD
jgi:hypothetical protein